MLPTSVSAAMMVNDQLPRLVVNKTVIIGSLLSRIVLLSKKSDEWLNFRKERKDI